MQPTKCQLLKVCAGQLVAVFPHLFNLSLRLRKVPKIDLLHNSSAKEGMSLRSHDYRHVVFTSYVMKTIEMLFLQHLRTLLTAFPGPTTVRQPVTHQSGGQHHIHDTKGPLTLGKAGKLCESQILRLLQWFQQHSAF